MRFLAFATELLLAVSSASAFRMAFKGSGTPPARAADYALDGTPRSTAGDVFKRSDSWPIYQDWFEQLIDHGDPSLGTFKQLYYYNSEYYAGPGSPIILSAPGEYAAENFTGYVTNLTLAGNFAKSVGGAAILLEHRYWGSSSPYAELTTDNLRYLTLNNSIQDLTYFANNVQLPFDSEGSSRPDKAPWVLTGCSYSGALSAWVHTLAPGTFWAYHCSSAVVQAVGNFWQYQSMVEMAMPENCSTDYTQVITHVDEVLESGSRASKTKLKENFGFGDWLDDRDFGNALQDGLGLIQNLAFDNEGRGEKDAFHELCDYVENRWPESESPQPGPEGVGLDAALNGLSKWFREVNLPGGCRNLGYPKWTEDDDYTCYMSGNESDPTYQDIRVAQPVNRQWQWMLCNEPFEWWRTGGSPENEPRMVSKLVTEDFWSRQCELYFSGTDDVTVGVEDDRTPSQINALTNGWDNVKTTRLMWTNGELDPWRGATVSSPWRPAGMLQSTDEAPVRLIPKATHCNDMLLSVAQANDDLMEIFTAEVDNVNRWVGEYYSERNQTWPQRYQRGNETVRAEQNREHNKTLALRPQRGNETMRVGQMTMQRKWKENRIGGKGA